MHIAIRADSSTHIGFGHVVRALTLGRALKEAGASVTVMGLGVEAAVSLSPSFAGLDVCELTGFDEAADVRKLKKLRPDGLVIDGYHFTSHYFESLDTAGWPYAIIDDNGETAAKNPTFIVNHNPHANSAMYAGLANRPTVLFGLEYCLLRPEVAENLAQQKTKTGNTVLLGLGGTDPRGFTGPLASGLLEAGFSVRVNQKFAQELSQRYPPHFLEESVWFFSSDSFLQSLTSADLAVLGAGVSLWEASALGVPTVGLIVADNQVKPALAGFQAGYVASVVDASESASVGSPVKRVVETARGYFSAQDRAYSVRRVPTNGAEKVARAILGEFSSHV